MSPWYIPHIQKWFNLHWVTQSRNTKNQLRVCFYFSLLNYVGIGVYLFTFYISFESVLFSSHHRHVLVLSLVTSQRIPSVSSSASLSSVTTSHYILHCDRIFPSKNTRITITFKIIQWLPIAFRIEFQPAIHPFMHSTSI